LHQRRFAGARVAVSSPQGRFADAAVVDGRLFSGASVWGKHLFHHYDGGPIVHVHLGLYGTFREAPVPMALPVGQVRMRIVGAEYGTDLRGPTACELLDEAQVSAIVARLGPDPLRRDADPDLAGERIMKSRKIYWCTVDGPAGDRRIGNVYRSELLFRHHIDPYRPGATSTAVSSPRRGPIWWR